MPPGKLLDIGYAKGSFADFMMDLDWKCFGIDLNKHSFGEIGFAQGDVNYGLPFAGESVDVITAGEIIEHVLDEANFLKECYRVLKPGGILVVTTPNLSFWINRIRMFARKTPLFVYAPYHYHFYTRKTLVGLLERGGFRIKKVLSSHILFSRRRHPIGLLFEILADFFPNLGAHLIVFGQKE